jgi:hypothetical protein
MRPLFPNMNTGWGVVCKTSSPLSVILIAISLFAKDAYAHGISGGVGFAHFIFGLLLGAVAIVLLGVAFILKHYKGTLSARVCVVTVTIVVLLELFSFSTPVVFEAINPWYSGDAQILSALTILLIVGLLFFVYEQWRIRLVVILVTFGLVVFEAFITPHARIFYPNQPLSGDVITIKPYSCRNFGLPDGRILHVEDQCVKTGPRDLTLSASLSEATNIHGERVYRITLRTKKSYLEKRSIKESDKWILRNPFVPTYQAVYAGEGKILGEDWRATGEMLERAANGYNYSIEWVKEVISHGADINVKSYGYDGILYGAVRSRDYELAEVLVEAGRDVNMKSNGETPLHLAANTDYRITKLLLDHGADMHAVDEEGLKPIDVARESLRTTPSYYKKRLSELLKIEKELLKREESNKINGH